MQSKTKSRLLIILIAFVVFIIPTNVWQLYEVLILNNCDQKFGCFGTIKLVMLISVIFSLVSTITLAICVFVLRLAPAKVPTIIGSFFLGMLYWQFLAWEILKSTQEMAAAWVFVSIVTYALLLWVYQRGKNLVLRKIGPY